MGRPNHWPTMVGSKLAFSPKQRSSDMPAGNFADDLHFSVFFPLHWSWQRVGQEEAPRQLLQCPPKPQQCDLQQLCPSTGALSARTGGLVSTITSMHSACKGMAFLRHCALASVLLHLIRSSKIYTWLMMLLQRISALVLFCWNLPFYVPVP